MYNEEPNIKRKNVNPLRVIVNQWGCLFGLVMLGLGVAMGLLGAIFVGPQLLGFDMTATALMEREIILASTEVDLSVRESDANAQATNFALDSQATQAFMNNDANLLAQTATQSAQNIVATNTASAVQSAQRQTQIANDYVSTQAALNANATQVSIDFRNTQSALGINNSNAQSSADNTVAGTALPRYSFDMRVIDLNTTNWQLSNRLAWENTSEGIIALTNGARLIEQSPRILANNNFDTAYTITADIRPATALNTAYWILFSVGDEVGLGAYFQADTLAINDVALYQFTSAQVRGSETLNPANMSIIQRNIIDEPLSSQTQLSVEVNGDVVSIMINGEAFLQINNMTLELGSIGVELPAQASLMSISVDD
ncbi:MAG: hypothetical protein Phog2KO_23000 [Phototrophicaceae bacterium]